MGIRRKRCLELARLACIPLLASTLAYGSAFSVVVNSSTSFNGSPVTLAFDYIDGGQPDNVVTLSALTFSSDWIPDGAPSDSPLDNPPGGVCGLDPTCPAPWTFTDAGGACSFCELQVPFSAMGTTLSFSFTTTDNPPGMGSGSFPDSFSFFFLVPPTNLVAFPTDDPLGADSLFLFSIGSGPSGLSGPYSLVDAQGVEVPGFSLIVTPAPEPGTLALLAAGFGAVFMRRRLR